MQPWAIKVIVNRRFLKKKNYIIMMGITFIMYSQTQPKIFESQIILKSLGARKPNVLSIIAKTFVSNNSLHPLLIDLNLLSWV
jgi:hypothetical protein